MERRWTDQPKELEQAKVLFDGFFNDRGIEVREGNGQFYVTQGGLFGSQTLKCKDHHAAFRAMNAISRGKKGMSPPEDCELME